MSRSYKKEVFKDKPLVEYNKRYRRVNRVRVNLGLEPLDNSEITNDYKYLKGVNNIISK